MVEGIILKREQVRFRGVEERRVVRGGQKSAVGDGDDDFSGWIS